VVSLDAEPPQKRNKAPVWAVNPVRAVDVAPAQCYLYKLGMPV